MMDGSFGRRWFLRTGLSVALFGLAGKRAAALVAHQGDSWDEAVMRPRTPMRPFGVQTVPYATPEKMATKIQMIRDLPRLTRHWTAVANHFRKLGRKDQLTAVNAFVNKVPYITDYERFGRLDAWDDPLHFFGKGGDCEEYALAKYALLRHLGFHKARLQLLALLRHHDGEGHAVLGVKLGGKVYILDQMSDEVVTDDRFKGYSLVYTICDSGVHVPA